MPKPKTIKVRITAWQRVRYDQTKEMTTEEYEELRDVVENAASDRDVSDAFDGWIDLADVDDGEEFEDVEIEKV